MSEIGWKGLEGLSPGPQVPKKADESTGDTGVSFQKVLQDSLKEVNDLQNEAEKAIQDLARGETKDLHRTMVLLEKADLSFKLMMRVRNKLLEAYTEIMRIQV